MFWPSLPAALSSWGAFWHMQACEPCSTVPRRHPQHTCCTARAGCTAGIASCTCLGACLGLWGRLGRSGDLPATHPATCAPLQVHQVPLQRRHHQPPRALPASLQPLDLALLGSGSPPRRGSGGGPAGHQEGRKRFSADRPCHSHMQPAQVGCQLGLLAALSPTTPAIVRLPDLLVFSYRNYGDTNRSVLGTSQSLLAVCHCPSLLLLLDVAEPAMHLVARHLCMCHAAGKRVASRSSLPPTSVARCAPSLGCHSLETGCCVASPQCMRWYIADTEQQQKAGPSQFKLCTFTQSIEAFPDASL